MTALTEFAFDRPLLVGRRIVDNDVELIFSLLVRRVDFPLSFRVHMTRDSTVGVVV